MLSFDEWNVWYRTRRSRAERVKTGWPVAPQILEEVYTMQDALTFGGACISLLNHADRVRVACLAQLVNAIAPIMTETGGPAWRQTIFLPFAHFSNLGRGRVLRDAGRLARPTPPATTTRAAPRTTTIPLPAVPFLKLAAVHDEAAGALTLFALNRSLDQSLPLAVTAKGFEGLEVEQALELRDNDLAGDQHPIGPGADQAPPAHGRDSRRLAAAGQPGTRLLERASGWRAAAETSAPQRLEVPVELERLRVGERLGVLDRPAVDHVADRDLGDLARARARDVG